MHNCTQNLKFLLLDDTKINCNLLLLLVYKLLLFRGSFGNLEGKESACNVRDAGSIPGSGRSPGEGKGYSSIILQYYYLDYSMTEETGRL